MLDPSDTIVAISSHPGPAARGIVRLSGPEALAIALDGFDGDGPTPLPGRSTAYSGRIRLDDPPSSLTATLVVWPGPRSYTGQPVAEIHTIGSPPLLEHLVARCLACGARLAEPGEFTLRAFLSGRIDLAQSEAVLRVIEARTPGQLDAAVRQLAGGLAGPVRDLRDRLLDRLVDLEANLDFVDEADIPPVVREALMDELDDSSRRLAELRSRHRSRGRSESRPVVVLAGPPNAGKSRLFNALLGDDRAIVAPIAGTTRDDLSAPSECDGLQIELVDTAGEDIAASPIAEAAQDRRAARLAEADLVIHCVASDGRDASVSAPAEERRTLVVATKADLSHELTSTSSIATSALTGDGLPALRSAIAGRLPPLAGEAGSDREIGPQSGEALDRAAESVANALRLGRGQGSEELIAVEIRQAIDELGKLVGAVISEDILDRIFRRFCVGK